MRRLLTIEPVLPVLTPEQQQSSYILSFIGSNIVMFMGKLHFFHDSRFRRG